MIIPIQIYSDDLVAQFPLTKKDIEDLISGMISQISFRFARAWEDQAKSSLKSARNEYVRSLKIFTEGPLKGGVMLTGWLPNAVESGISGFDMKAGFLASPKVKHGKNGSVYLTIPFRFATAGSLGESSIFSGTLPASVEKSLKQSSKPSLSKSAIPSAHSTPNVRPQVQTNGRVFEEYKHKSSIYEGLTRSTKTYQGGSSSQYNTFRRVSLNSASNSWIHSGIRAYNLAEKALGTLDLPSEVGKAIDDNLAKIGFGV